jgi:hypothetical protein
VAFVGGRGDPDHFIGFGFGIVSAVFNVVTLEYPTECVALRMSDGDGPWSAWSYEDVLVISGACRN